MKPSKVAFLDRDGVINIDFGYVGRREDFIFLPGAIRGLRKLAKQGYRIVIVTNQAGIARGYYTESDFLKLTSWMVSMLEDSGVEISEVLYCPHHPDGIAGRYGVVCECRKPKSGLFVDYLKTVDFEITGTLMIGDKLSDLHAAAGAGVEQLFLVSRDTGGRRSAEGMFFTVCRDLLEVANQI